MSSKYLCHCNNDIIIIIIDISEFESYTVTLF